MPKKFVVIHDSILGVVRGNLVQILACDGAYTNWRNGTYPLAMYPAANVRPAVRADFETFRVESKGYENDPDFDFPIN